MNCRHPSGSSLHWYQIPAHLLPFSLLYVCLLWVCTPILIVGWQKDQNCWLEIGWMEFLDISIASVNNMNFPLVCWNGWAWWVLCLSFLGKSLYHGLECHLPVDIFYELCIWHTPLISCSFPHLIICIVGLHSSFYHAIRFQKWPSARYLGDKTNIINVSDFWIHHCELTPILPAS